LYILFKQEFEIEFVPSLQIRKMNSGEGWSRPLWRHLINQMRKWWNATNWTRRSSRWAI